MFFEKNLYYVFVKYYYKSELHYQILYQRDNFDKCCEFLYDYYKKHRDFETNDYKIIDYAIVYVDMHMNLTTLSNIKDRLDKGCVIYE